MNKTKAIIYAILMFLLGATLGVTSKLLDIHTSNLGNIFSQMSIWYSARYLDDFNGGL